MKRNLEHEVACFLASYADILWARHAFCLLRLRDEAKECLRRGRHLFL